MGARAKKTTAGGKSFAAVSASTPAVLAYPISAERKKELLLFCRNTGLRFKNLSLLNLALTHRSVSNEQSFREYPAQNNERLEFLGDSVLGVVAATVLYREYGGRPEGDLAKIKSVVVSEDILCGIARELQIDKLLLLGRGEELSGGRTKNALLADALEALIGALYLDGGFKAAFPFVEQRIRREIVRVTEGGYHRDYKSLLQEYSQRKWKKYPVYRCVKGEGAEHDKIFWIEVAVQGKVYGPCAGRNKKTAEQEAARRAWTDLAVEIM